MNVAPQLFNCSDGQAWHAHRWPHFDQPTDAREALVIQPVFSLSEWALGRPLDAEEVLGAELLRRALACSGTNTPHRYVLPPLRITPRQSVGTCFALDIECAHQMLREQLRSAGFAGYRKFVLFNTSPFLEEWVDVAARDLRVDEGYQMFCVNLSGLGLDFHPQRGGARGGVQAALTHLLGSPPESVSAIKPEHLDPIPGAAVVTDSPLPGEGEAAVMLDRVASRFAAMLGEIDQHPALRTTSPSTQEDPS